MQAFMPAEVFCGAEPVFPVPHADAQLHSYFPSHEPVIGVQHLHAADIARNGLANHRIPPFPFQLKGENAAKSKAGKCAS
jgi:hypothetical protein